MLGCRVGVAPRVAHRAVGRRIVTGRLLPLGLGRQPPSGPAGVGVRLVPADVHHRLVEWHGLRDAEPAPQPLARLPAPEPGRGDGVAADVRPALRRPPARVVVAAVLDERQIRAVRHRGRVDVEGGHLPPVRGPFVVQRPGLGGGAHRERAAGDEDFGRAREQRDRLRVGGRQRLWPGAELMGDQHRFVVLLFVLGDHPEGEAHVGEPGPAEGVALQYVRHPAAHLGRVLPRLLGRQQRQRGALGARVLERVVEAVDVGAHRVPATDGAQQPQFLLVADVREVPDQRGHQRRYLGGEFGLVHAAREERGAVPGRGQSGQRPLPERLDVDVGRCVGRGARGRVGGEVGVGHVRMSFPCGRLSVPRTRSSRSSAGQRPRTT